MSRTRIEDLSSDDNELFDLSEEQMLMSVVGGDTVIENPLGGTLTFKSIDTYFSSDDVRTDYDIEWDT